MKQKSTERAPSSGLINPSSDAIGRSGRTPTSPVSSPVMCLSSPNVHHCVFTGSRASWPPQNLSGARGQGPRAKANSGDQTEEENL